MMPSEERASLNLVLKCLEGEFYSEAKKTASSLASNTRVRHHGKTEREYAKSQALAPYAYKDVSWLHIESQCRDQFLAGLRCRDVKAHLSWFCSKDGKVHELVSRAEAFRATPEENTLMSDTEGNAVTVAYVQGNKPGKSFVQHQYLAPVSSALKPPTDRKARNNQPKKKDFRTCVGKCCFKCGKEGHFITECRSRPNKCLFLAFDAGLLLDDKSNNERCRCICGNHAHFMNQEDEHCALAVLEGTVEKPAN